MAPALVELENIHHHSKAFGPLPIINRFLERLRLDQFFDDMVPAGDCRQKLRPAVGLGVLLRNILISSRPLYLLPEWAGRYESALLGLPGNDSEYLNDDRAGRCLDALFKADRVTLMTRIMVHAVDVFGLELKQLHNDSTTVTFTGEYEEADGRSMAGSPTLRVTPGFNKDHRPELKQLLFILTTTADGAVPIFSHTDHGNTSDDTTHIRTWDSLVKLYGSPDFLYVADCKLCSHPNLVYIATRGGRFVTVIPASWNEHKQFHEWLRSNSAPWVEVLRKPNPRKKDGPDHVYGGYEHPMTTAEGFRVLWYHSSQKEATERRARQNKLATANEELQDIAARICMPHARLNTVEQVREAAEEVLAKRGVTQFIQIEINICEEPVYKQAGPGRPSSSTAFNRSIRQRPVLTWRTNEQALCEEMRTDGIFPLVTNDKTLSLKEALLTYKHQPSLEKRHEQLKSFLEVRPVSLKNPMRIEASLFLYFLALLTEALIERDMRARMQRKDIEKLKIYPEERAGARPTTQRLVEVFADVRRHRLVDQDGRVIQEFHDSLSEAQRIALELFNISPAEYFADAEVPACR